MINYPDSIRVYDNFLPEETAQNAYAQLSSLPQQWFSFRKTLTDQQTHEQKSVRTWWSIHGNKSENSRLDPTGKPSYQYLATDNHQPGCNCLYCDLVKIFQINPPPEASGEKLLESYLSIYQSGNFHSQHFLNKDNSSWAFIYNLTTGWRPEWGGVINIEHPNGGWYAFPPVFNQLILIDLSEASNIKTFTSKVIDESPVNKIALHGWYT